MKKQNRMKYNKGSIVNKKTISDLDLSLRGSGGISSERGFISGEVNVRGKNIDVGYEKEIFKENQFKESSKGYGIGYTSDKGLRVGISQQISPENKKETTLSISKLLK